MKVVLVGSGNVASVLGRMIKRSGHSILRVISQDAEHARILADELGCRYGAIGESFNDHADLYIIAVKDEAIPAIKDHMHVDSRPVVHTAGSVSKNVLKGISSNYGVIYPLQSLRKEVEPSQLVPLLIDGNSTETITLLQDFAKTISPNVALASDEERLKMHVAAVVVSNFTNHLYALAEEYCKKEKVDFKLLAPLIEETAHRVAHASPALLQTGPAARKDKHTIEKHLALLEDDKQLQAIYKMLTESIMEKSAKK